MAWSGQAKFNLDDTGFLTLSALWTAWRHHFVSWLALGVLAFFGGMMFVTIYLPVASYQIKGDAKAVPLAMQRANA